MSSETNISGFTCLPPPIAQPDPTVITIGKNPDHDHGCWPNKEQAAEAFASQFAQLCMTVGDNYLRILSTPTLVNVHFIEKQTKNWSYENFRMVGRFRIIHNKDSE